MISKGGTPAEEDTTGQLFKIFASLGANQQDGDGNKATTTTTATTRRSIMETTNTAISSLAAPTSTDPSAAMEVIPAGCTTLQKRLIQKSIPDANSISWATRCPDSSAWLSIFFQEASATEPFIFLNFGCNKGYDSLFMAETISRNTQVFNKEKWTKAIGTGHLGNCHQGGDNGKGPIHRNLPQRPVEVHCIEAMPQMADKLLEAAKVTRAKDNGLHVYNYAMTGTPGGSPILFPNPTGRLGVEHLGLGRCEEPKFKPECKEVPTRTVDEFVQEHVDNNGSSSNKKRKRERRIPFISIDVEGFDYTVMMGAMETLKRTDYLEFEYHEQGDWRNQKLEDAMHMLKDLGFVCYWSGVNQLWKLTDTCWLDHFEFHQWSNVACVAPKYQPKLAARMEQVFEDTLVQNQVKNKS